MNPTKKCLFALPGHEWVSETSPVVAPGQITPDDIIRAKDDFVLVRRQPLLPSLPAVEEDLKQPDALAKRLAKKFGWSKKFVKGAAAANFLDGLANFIKATIAQKKMTENREEKKASEAQKKGVPPPPRATVDEAKERELLAAAETLFYIVSKGCQSLTDLARQHPALFKQVARGKKSWPLMMSVHPAYSEKPLIFLKQIEQGKQADVNINQTSRYGTQGMAQAKQMKEIAEALLNCVSTEWNSHGERLDGKPIEKFDDSTSEEWWKIARARLLESYPEPGKIPELDRLVTAPSRRKVKAHRRSDILAKLKEAFLVLAPLSTDSQRL